MRNYLRIEIEKDDENYTQALEVILLNNVNPRIVNYEDDDQFKNENTIIICDNDKEVQEYLSEVGIEFNIIV